MTQSLTTLVLKRESEAPMGRSDASVDNHAERGQKGQMRVHSDKQPCPCGCEYYAQAHAELLGSTMTAMVTFKKRQYTMDERKNEEEIREFERKGSTEDTELTIESVCQDE